MSGDRLREAVEAFLHFTDSGGDPDIDDLREALAADERGGGEGLDALVARFEDYERRARSKAGWHAWAVALRELRTYVAAQPASHAAEAKCGYVMATGHACNDDDGHQSPPYHTWFSWRRP